MSFWRWKALRFVEAAGWPGVLAVVVLASAGVVWFALALPLDVRAEGLRAGNADLEARILKSKKSGPRANMALTTEQQLDVFEHGFPSDKDWSATYLHLWTLASRHGVQLRQAEFSRSGGEQDALSRYAVVVPASADYASLRAFLADALRDMPNLAIEEMSLKRDDARSTRLDAHLRLVIFLVKGAAHG